ncbi:MAG TPA: magnesium transporter CorA family protein [Chlamydiales bacterium]|jgi:magnesium transporter|nr:magnesium transporter CorA family protein [Chlamydiales bacterium]
MIEIYFKTVRDAEFNRIQDFRAGSWIYVHEASFEELTKISEVAGIDIDDIRDSLDKYEMPRIERIGENILLFIRHPSDVEFGHYTATLTMILTNNFVIAISPTRSETVEHLLQSHTPLGTTQKAKLILHILLKITQDYTTNVKRIHHGILENERSFRLVDTNAIGVLTKNEEILNQYLMSLVPMRNTLEALGGGRYLSFYEEDIDLLKDLMIAIHQSEDVCSVNIKSIRSLRDSYQIIFTNKVNRTIKLLTALTIIFHIPTIMASVYGMNIPLPFQKSEHAFALFFGTTIIFSFIAVLLFRRNRWL